MVLQVRAYPPSWRIVAASLLIVSRGGLLVLLVALLFFDTPLQNPLRLLRVFALVCLAPESAAWLLRRAFATTLRIESGVLVLESSSRRIEIPRDIVATFEPWSLPLPGDGLWLRLHSGRRFEYGLETGVPTAVIEAALGSSPVAAPPTLFAPAGRHLPRWWDHPVFKFVIVALVPAVPLFRLHQWITFGGTFGEYYQFGLEAYLLAFAVFWAQAAIWLVLYAAALRALVEMCAMFTALAAPSYTLSVRRVAERASDVLYYGGIALFLVRLFVLSRV